MKTEILIPGAFLLLIISGNVHPASFDCSHATTSVEKLICADQGLSQLDENLSRTYQEVLRSMPKLTGLKQEQAKWLREVRDLCTDGKCLEREYRNRLVAIEKLLPTKSALCHEFQRLLSQPIGLIDYKIEEKEIEQEDFNSCIPNVDVDGDRIEDKILLSRGGSGSIIPADYDYVTLKLSSTEEKFTAEMQRFYIIRYKAKYYIVASNLQGEEGPRFVDIKSMDRRGIKQICSYDCSIYRNGPCVSQRHHRGE
jgi:uncharacterized protein